MKEHKQEQLAEEYPDLYRWYDESPDSSERAVPPLALYGFSVGDGWYNLIKSLSEQLSRLDVEVEVVQVKEKFGGLRYYHDGIQADEESDSYMAMGAIQQAEEMSFHVCEECGAAAELRTSGWYRTLCDDCWDEHTQRVRDESPRDLD